jgi:tripartite ATP-independent transporter DctP family solute receptor
MMFINRSRLTNLSFVMTLIVSAILVIPSSASAAKKIVMKVSHATAESTAVHAGWVKFKELVEKGSHGEIVVEIYPNGQMGSDRELIEATQLGNLAGATVSTSPVAAFDSNFFILDIPFMFTNRADVYKVLDGTQGKTLLKSCEKYQLKCPGFFENGFRHLTNSKRPVRTPADLKGMKLRTMENPVHMMAWKALGANPTPMAFGELFTALQQKTVDGQENPMELIFFTKFSEVQPYLTKTQHIYTAYVVLFNLELWNELSTAQQDLLQKSVDEAVVYQRKMATEAEKIAEEGIRKGGTEILEITPEERSQFQQAVKVVLPEVTKRVNKDIYDLFITK